MVCYLNTNTTFVTIKRNYLSVLKKTETRNRGIY